jgi:hypothetical protein
MSDSELIVKVDGSLAEGGGHFVMQRQSSLQDLGAHVLHLLLELLEVTLKIDETTTNNAQLGLHNLSSIYMGRTDCSCIRINKALLSPSCT